MRGGLSRTTVVLICALVLINCGSPDAVPFATRSAAPIAIPSTASPTALSYLRAIDGVTYIPMAPDVERRVVALFEDAATSYAARDVTLSTSTAKLRLVVLWMSDKFAATKPLNDVTGMGGPNSRPEKKSIGGLTTFLHTDVTPNFLAWQQGLILSLVYGVDRPAMETVAALLIGANR